MICILAQLDRANNSHRWACGRQFRWSADSNSASRYYFKAALTANLLLKYPIIKKVTEYVHHL
jgi:hypothetical protein